MGKKSSAKKAGRPRPALSGSFDHGPAPASTDSRAVIYVLAALAALLAFIVFIPALKNGFVIWDDNVLISENRNIQSLDLGFLKRTFTSVGITTWYPLTLISLAIDYALWGDNPWGFHLTNIIFHALNTFLVFILIADIAGRGEESKTKAIIAGLVTALLFALHPLRVESVVWVTERKDVLYAFFYLLSVFAYIRYASSGRVAPYLAALFFFIVSLLSKPMAVSLPVVLLILDFYPLERLLDGGDGRRNLKKAVAEKIPFFILALLTSLLTVVTNYGGGALRGMEKNPFFARVLVALRAHVFYLSKMLFPVNLAPFYPYPSRAEIFSLEYIGPAAVFLAVTFLSVLLVKKRKVFSAVWFYYVAAIAPVSGIVQIGEYAAANRYTYLASLGPFLIVGLLSGVFFEKLRAYSKKYIPAFLAAAFLIILCVFVNATLKEIPKWKDTMTLWSYEIELFPQKASFAYNNRGLAYYRAGDLKSAFKDYNRAIEIAPGLAQARINRGNIYRISGDPKSALADYNRAIEINPRSVEARINRGNIYGILGDFKQAIEEYNLAISMDPENAVAHYNMALTYLRTGDRGRAIAGLKTASSLGLKEAKDFLAREKL